MESSQDAATPPRIRSIDEVFAREHDFSRVILDTAPVLVVVFDVEGKLVLFNRACEVQTGFSEEELRGKYLWDTLAPAADAERRKQVFGMLRQGKISGRFEARWQTRSGGERLVDWRTAILRDSSEDIVGVVGLGLDITEQRKTQDALAREQHFIRALIDKLPDGIVACDESGVLSLFNQKTREFHGVPEGPYRPDEWADRYGLFHPNGRPLAPEEVPLYRALRGEHVRDAEIVIRSATGESRFVLCSGDLLVTESGTKLGALVQMHDDTERRAAEDLLRESERRLREQNLQLECLFGLARDLTQSMSQSHLDQMLNAAMERIAQLLGASGCALLVRKHSGQLDAVHAFPGGVGAKEVPSRFSLDGGETIAVPVERGGKEFGLLAARREPAGSWKESERRWLEAASDLIGSALERVALVDELSLRAAELERENRRAMEASQAKSLFLTNMSHEIRTPLNGILGLTQVVKASPELAEPHRASLEMIHQCGAHLLALVNDILDLSRIEAGRIELQPETVRLEPILHGLFEVFQASARDKGLDLVVESAPGAPGALVADARRLRQVLFNLAGNALKFTESGSVRLLVSLDEGEAPELRFAVQDTGPGIAAAFREKLFQSFERGAPERVTPGTGLGLAISARLADAMGGRIEVESGPEAGSTFTLVLPWIPAAAQPAAAARHEAGAPGGEQSAGTLSASFSAALRSGAVEHLLNGDLEQIEAALPRLRQAARCAPDEEWLRLAESRMAKLDMAGLYAMGVRHLQ